MYKTSQMAVFCRNSFTLAMFFFANFFVVKVLVRARDEAKIPYILARATRTTRTSNGNNFCISGPAASIVHFNPNLEDASIFRKIKRCTFQSCRMAASTSGKPVSPRCQRCSCFRVPVQASCS